MMNLNKALIAGLVGGIVLAVYDFIMHGLIMASTYSKYVAVFRKDAPMYWFPILAILLAIAAALFFAKSRGSWEAGAKGGMMFGFWIGLLAFLAQFYNPLIFNGFPYFLSWCWGAINLIGWVIAGAVIGAMYKAEA